jgi:hypothetical protein
VKLVRSRVQRLQARCLGDRCEDRIRCANDTACGTWALHLRRAAPYNEGYSGRSVEVQANYRPQKPGDYTTADRGLPEG